jgi:hypothetical protein
MITTPELRRQFEISFTKLVRSLSPESQKRWDGNISWKNDNSYPDIQANLIKEMPDAARAVYVSLLNKLSRGRI